MKRNLLHIIIAILLLFQISLLQSCRFFFEPEISTLEPGVPSETIFLPPVEHPSATPLRPGRFTLRYDPNSSFNPVTTLNRDNILVASLMYESLFVLDDNLGVDPLLCESWETEDNLTYRFRLKPNIAMSDGSWMTADDVAYSIRQTCLRGRFVNRLQHVVNVDSDGELTVTVVLNSPNNRFIYLLDTPIIKYGSIDEAVPPGTGPFTFISTGITRLERYYRHRDYINMPISSIYLVECADDELTQLFDDGGISLLWDDPSDSFDIRLNRLYDPRYYDTTTLQFIGFNGRSGVLSNYDVRRAIGCAIEREYIVNEIMPAGSAIPAPVPLPRSFPNYDYSWETDEYYSQFELMAVLFDRALLKDVDDDSFLELTDNRDGYSKVSLTFIVNSENLLKVQIAERITNTLRLAGLDITLRELPWDSYMSALQSGNFDVYYGEVALGADFDLSPLVLPGRLNYGDIASTGRYKELIDNFMVANDEEMHSAAGQLIAEITAHAPFVPVLFKRYMVYSPMGAVIGAVPSQSNVFRNITDWTINLTLLT